MTFVELLQQLEAQLGYHQVPLNPTATSLRDVFESGPLHHDLLIRVVREVYRSNHCRRLHDPVSRDATFNALTPIRQSLLGRASTDVDAYHVMDDVCRAVAHAFAHADGHTVGRRLNYRPGRAQVIDLMPFLRARRIRSWAG